MLFWFLDNLLFKEYIGKDDDGEGDFFVDNFDVVVVDDDDYDDEDDDDDDDDDEDFVVDPTFVGCWGLGKGCTDPILLLSLTPALCSLTQSSSLE